MTHLTYFLRDWNRKRRTRGHPLNDVVAYIRKNFSNSYETITGIYIAGGSVKDFALNQNISGDIDLFFDKSQTRQTVIERLQQDPTCKNIMESEHSTTMTLNISGRDYDVQLVHRKYYDNIADVLDDFDLTVCQWGVGFKNNDSDSGHLWTTDSAMWDTINGELNIVGFDGRYYELMRRISKYEQQGFRLTEPSRKNLLTKIADNGYQARQSIGQEDKFY